MKNFLGYAAGVGVCCFCLLLSSFSGKNKKENYLSPGAMTVDKTKNIVYTALTTNQSIAVSDLKTNRTIGQIELKQNPSGVLLSPDGKTLYVSCGDAKGTIEIISLPGKKAKASITVGHTPCGIALSADRKFLYVANRFSHNVSVINLSQNKEITTIPLLKEPKSICITPDGKTLVAANFLPNQASTDTLLSAQISLIDLPAHTVRSNLTLANGAQSIGGLTCSADGKYAYATHLISQFNLPVTQLDRGWVNTNALSIIDLKENSVYATVLLDDISNGAANPAGICEGKDQKLYIALSGTHELMVLDLNILHKKISALFSGTLKDSYIRNKDDLSSSLSFTSSFKKRIPLQGRSPREVVFSGNTILVSSRFSPFIEKLPVDGPPNPALVTLGKEPEADAVRRGELAFCDASICYQQWQSCVSCHPDGRADGLNWDQMNDGLGNPKNTKSLLFSHVTPPSMITGIRKSAEMAVRNGILHTLGTRQPETVAEDMDAYLKHLAPLESPYWEEYLKKDPLQQKGKEIFDRADCSQCHNGQHLTDLTKYNVGTGVEDDKETLFDTPTLREIWRTAPYLYDGRATSIMEVLSTYNKDDKHGTTQKLSKEELEILALYVLTR